MRLLVLGANGLLGSRVVLKAQAMDWTVVGTYHSERPLFDIDLHRLDVRNADRFQDFINEYDPSWVVNCAAMTDVDRCEAYPETAHAVNGRAPGTLAAKCQTSGAGFVQISTDYIFDGELEEPYVEDDDPKPLQTYGVSKLAGERAVKETHTSAIILRLSFVYGLHGSTWNLTGFPAWLRDQVESGGEVPLFTDQWVTPTRAGQAASVVTQLLAGGLSGAYHVASRSCVTPYEFGQAVHSRLESPVGNLVGGTIADFERPARRPRYTCLDVSKVEAELGRKQPRLESDLDAIADAL